MKCEISALERQATTSRFVGTFIPRNPRSTLPWRFTERADNRCAYRRRNRSSCRNGTTHIRLSAAHCFAYNKEKKKLLFTLDVLQYSCKLRHQIKTYVCPLLFFFFYYALCDYGNIRSFDYVVGHRIICTAAHLIKLFTIGYGEHWQIRVKTSFRSEILRPKSVAGNRSTQRSL